MSAPHASPLSSGKPLSTSVFIFPLRALFLFYLTGVLSVFFKQMALWQCKHCWRILMNMDLITAVWTSSLVCGGMTPKQSVVIVLIKHCTLSAFCLALNKKA